MEGRPDDDPEVMALFCPQEDDGVFDPKAELDAALQHENVELERSKNPSETPTGCFGKLNTQQHTTA